MWLPFVNYVLLDLPIEAFSLFVLMMFFVATSFHTAGSGWTLARVGVKRLGRPAVEGINTGVLLFVLGITGGIAGCALANGNPVIIAICAIGLVVPNALLFFIRREYLFGTDTAQGNADEPRSDIHD